MPPELLAGPYHAPFVRRGDWLDDEIDGAVKVGGYSEGRIAWPKRLKTGNASLILCADLVRAVRTESALAVQYWWGVGPVTVWKWRKALGVNPQNCAGTQALYKAFKPIKLPDHVVALGLERASGPKARAKMSQTKTGVPAPPSVRAGLLRAAMSQTARSPGWGKLANERMLAAKRRKAALDEPPA